MKEIKLLMIKVYNREFIGSLKNKFIEKLLNLEDFLKSYQEIVNIDNKKPLFSPNFKPDYFTKRKNIKKCHNLTKGNNAWTPSIPESDIEKIKKNIKIILNKITKENFSILIETLVCEISKFHIIDILDILTSEIIEKIIYDKSFHEIYIKLCSRVWNMTTWHQNLITIILDENNKYFWHQNRSNGENQLMGPYDSEEDIRKKTNKLINFRYDLLNKLYDIFEKKDEYIKKSNEKNIDDDLRYKYKRNIVGTIEFIAKLYKVKQISEKVIHVCILDLLKYKKDILPKEEEPLSKEEEKEDE